MATTTAERDARGRSERLCASARDATMLRVKVLDELRRIVDFDAYVWLMTDPRTTVGSAPCADVPSLPELAKTIRLKYLTPLNRWTYLDAEGAVVGTLRQASGGDLAKSLLWRGVLSRYGILDVASAVFANRYGVWGFLDLWRTGTKAAYDDTDAIFLASIAPTLTTALQRCQASTLTAPAVEVERELGPVVFLLDDDLTILSQTPGGESWLQILLPGPSPVPASVYNVAGQLLAAEHGVDHHPAMARVHLSNGFWVTLRAARLDRPAAGEGLIAVTMEETSPADRLELFCRAFGLTSREEQLVSLLATGSDTRDLARHMFLAENTVQDHLKSVFAKTATRNRRTLLARALGVRRPHSDAGSD